MSPEERKALICRAAACYERAGLTENAAQCWEDGGEPARAAPLHRALGRLEQAALAHERAGQPGPAAECYAAAGDHAAALGCLVAAGQLLEAAWTAAHHLGRVAEARALLGRVEAEDELTRLSLALVRDRCARRGEAVVAIADAWPGLGLGAPRLASWALALAEAIDRPDLSAMLYAAMDGSPGVANAWESWAGDRLGDRAAARPEVSP